MKRKNFLILLAAGCLFSCQQQDELQETSKEATNFSISIDDALSDPLTRTSNDLFPARNSITTGEVISMAASGQDYTPFIVGKDSRAWNEIGTATGTVTFYAHYPALTDEAATRSGGNKRYLKRRSGALVRNSGSSSGQPECIAEIQTNDRAGYYT